MKQPEYNISEYTRGYLEGRHSAIKELRDEIAMSALQGMIQDCIVEREIPGMEPKTEGDLIVERAYEIADKMMEARKQEDSK